MTIEVSEDTSFLLYQDNGDGTCTMQYHIKRDGIDDDMDGTFVMHKDFEELLMMWGRDTSPEHLREFDEIATEIPNKLPDEGP